MQFFRRSGFSPTSGDKGRLFRLLAFPRSSTGAPEGLPLAYEVLLGNTADNATLRGFLDRIERQYGKARRVWLMDRGVATAPLAPNS
jgi:hypothetical protein